MDLDPPEPAPAGPLKAQGDRPGKASLHEMLTGSEVSFGPEGLRPVTHEPDFLLPEMAPEGSACLGISALVPQGAGLADFGLALVLAGLSISIVSCPF